MSIFMTKEWREVTAEELRSIPVSTGVYQIADADETILDIGIAGALEPFGLRSKITQDLKAMPNEGFKFRYEEHFQYQSRYVELVLAHKSRHGAIPPKVEERGETFRGRIAIDN